MLVNSASGIIFPLYLERVLSYIERYIFLYARIRVYVCERAYKYMYDIEIARNTRCSRNIGSNFPVLFR